MTEHKPINNVQNRQYKKTIIAVLI